MEPMEQNPLHLVFTTSLPKKQQITLAVLALQELLGKPENQSLAEKWAGMLMIYPSESLASALTTVSLTSKGWPTLGDITEAILEQEYAAEFCWIVSKLARHGREWKDRDPVYEPDKRLGYDKWEKGAMLKPAEPAPEIPARIRAALEILGGGVFAEGMREMNRHPTTGSFQYENAAEAGRVKGQLERDFKAAWYTVRRRELGGSR